MSLSLKIKNGGIPMGSMKGKYQPMGVGMTPSKTEFGSFLRTRRLELKIRQVPLAQKAKLPQNVVSQLEIGTRKYLSDRQLKQLAKALECDAEELRKHMPVKPGTQPTTELGTLIRSRREELGLTLQAFAKKMKTNPAKAKFMELHHSTIEYDQLKLLASALNLDPSSLSRFVGKRKSKATTSELGQLIRSRRKELGISTEKLADRLNVSHQFVSQIESGQCPLSQDDELLGKLAQILKLDVAQLEAVRPERKMKPVQTERANPLIAFLTAKRLSLRLTQRELGERAKLATVTVSLIETGKYRPSSRVLEKITKVLDCQVPPELIPLYNTHGNNGHKIIRESPLGEFITTQRLKLNLNQAELARRADISTSVISGLERGTYRAGVDTLKKISGVLESEIPTELYSPPGERRIGLINLMEFPSSLVVRLSDQNLADLERIRELSDIHTNSEVIRKALKLLRLLLEKQSDKHSICLRKDGNVVELEFFS